MQAIFRLIEGDALRAFQDFMGNLLAAMSRQTVHHDRVFLGHADDLAVDLIVSESAAAALRFLFLAHTRPNIRINRVRAADRFLHRLRHGYIGAGGASFCDDFTVGIVTLRASQRKRKRHEHGGFEPRMNHIIAIADKCDLQAIELALVLEQCLAIGKDLTGMIEIGQRVDDRHRGIGGHLFERRLGERAHGNQIDPARQAARAIGGRFAGAEPDLGAAHKNHAAAQLIHADLESGAGAQTGLFKNQSEAFTRQ